MVDAIVERTKDGVSSITCALRSKAVHIPWYIAAIGAALMWGIHYPLVDHALKRVSLVTVLLLTALPIVLVAVFAARDIAADYAALRTMPWTDQLAIFGLAVTSFGGTVLLYLSITGKNATLASLIEISYPVFVALFAYLLFRQIHFNANVILGAVLVFAGVGIIIWNNPH
jgi:drug/metabolite transporter (DMT)-like permease